MSGGSHATGTTDRIPVVYVTVPPAATARMIATEFARFLGLPVRARSNMADIIEAVVGVCTDTRTAPVLVDELHNISLTSRHGAEVADTLKYFSERLPATFVYAGIDIDESGLLSGTRGAQIAGRFTLIPSRPFPCNSEWKGLVATMEDTLRLHEHRCGTLTDLDRFLHNHTGGMIGSLSHAIRGAALDAFLTGTRRSPRRASRSFHSTTPPTPRRRWPRRPQRPDERRAAAPATRPKLSNGLADANSLDGMNRSRRRLPRKNPFTRRQDLAHRITQEARSGTHIRMLAKRYNLRNWDVRLALETPRLTPQRQDR
ncbi:hypothetical protein GCM10009863_21860 [Streptomyces axinellae]|uniref:Uncharacterized protein n=2 Tax=Streptomyces axinellae TaxID=552788 RepID=A0ABN3PY98_9ACTN